MHFFAIRSFLSHIGLPQFKLVIRAGHHGILRLLLKPFLHVRPAANYPKSVRSSCQSLDYPISRLKTPFMPEFKVAHPRARTRSRFKFCESIYAFTAHLRNN